MKFISGGEGVAPPSHHGQALTGMTINCARQMLIEDARGSISEGKYADLPFVDKDVHPAR